MRPAVLDLVRLALDGAYVFHGSPTSFDELRPSHTIRSCRDKVMYDGVSAHASHVLGVAISYIARAPTGYSTGVSLHTRPFDRHIYVGGPKGIEDAVKRLFGSGGYLYAFDTSRHKFGRRRGFGRLEVASFEAVTPDVIVKVSFSDFMDLVQIMGIKLSEM